MDGSGPSEMVRFYPGAPLAPGALVSFYEKSSLWPYPHAPLGRSDIAELDFADTSALGDIYAIERWRLNDRNDAKTLKEGREHHKVKRSWDHSLF